MPSKISESDWQQFKAVHRRLLEKYCERLMEEVRAASQDGAETAHERYLKVHDLIMERRREMSSLFDDYRRSTALFQLGLMHRMELLTDKDLALFSESAKERVLRIGSL